MSKSVIDEFLVTLGIDGAMFDKGMDSAEKRQRKLGAAARQWDKERTAARRKEERETKQQYDRQAREGQAAYRALRRDAIGFLTVFSAGKGIKNFISDTINGAANLGYLSANLQKSAEDLTAWQHASQRAGGSAEGIVAQFKESADTLAQLRNGFGPNEGLQSFFRFGGSSEDLKDSESYLLARSKIINEAFQTDPAKAALYAKQMVIIEDQFNLIKQGPTAINALVAAQQKNSVVTAESAKKAQELRNQWLDFTQTLEATTIKVLIAAIPALGKFADGLVLLANNIGDHKDDIASFVGNIADFVTNTDWSQVIADAKEFGAEIKSIADSMREIIQRYDDWTGKSTVQTPGVSKLPGNIAFGKTEDIARDNKDTGRAPPVTPDLKGWRKNYVEGLDKGLENTSKTFAPLSKSKHPIIDMFFGGSIRDALIEIAEGKRPGDGVSLPPRKVDPSRSGYIMDYLRSKGWTNEQAAGITGSLAQESDLDPNNVNPKSGARGIAQWLSKDRLAAFRKKYGKDLSKSTLDEQLDFMQYELTQGDEKEAGDRLRKAKTAGEAAVIHRKFYERPGEDEANDARRRAIGEQLAAPGRAKAASGAATVPSGAAASAPATLNKSSNVTNTTSIDNITINTRATDAIGIAQEIAPAVEKYTFANNATSGMQS